MNKENKKVSYYYKSDFLRMTGRDTSNIAFFLFHYFGEFRLRYVFYLRWLQLHSKKHILYPLFYTLKMLSGRKHGLEIAHNTTIGPGLYLGHPYNITVGGGAVLGKNVNLHKGATIGAENRGKRKGIPTLGDNISVGINSTIVGNITVGSDVMIASNSFINRDIPEHSVVFGNPAVVKSRQNATESYVVNRV